MPYERVDQAEIARFLDIAELLPKQLAVSEDKTAAFRSLLADLVGVRPKISHLLSRFDDGDMPRW